MRPRNGTRRPFEFEALEHRFLMAGDLRTAMPGEGYLHFSVSDSEVGYERLGRDEHHRAAVRFPARH